MAQLPVDVTLRCVLNSESEAHAAQTDMEMAYLELATSGHCILVVMAIETIGRRSDEAAELIRLLSHAKAREAPSHMRGVHVGNVGGRACSL